MDATIRGQAESISKSLFKYLELFLTHDFPNRTTGICGGHLRHLVALQMRLDCCQNNHKRRRWPIISRLDTLLHFSHCQRQGALGTGQVVSRRPFCWHQKRCEELSRRRRCSGGRTKWFLFANGIGRGRCTCRCGFRCKSSSIDAFVCRNASAEPAIR